MIFYMVMSLSGVATGFLSSLVSKDLVDIVTGQKKGELLRFFLLTIVIALVNVAIAQLTNYFSLRISLSVSTAIKTEIFDRMTDSEWEGLKKYHSGDLMSRISGDSGNIASGVLSFIPGIVTNAARFFGALAMVLWYDWTFAIFALLGIPFSLIISRKMVGRMQQNSLDASKKNADVYGFMQETFTNIGFVKAFSLLDMYTKKFRESLTEYNRMQIDYNRMSIVSSIIMSLAGLLVSYTSYGWGIYRVWSGVISYGTMTMFLSLSGTLTGSVSSLGSSFSQAISLDTSARRILEILDLRKDDFSDDKRAEHFLNLIEKKDFSIHIENASFHYRDDEKEVFSDVSLQMKKGRVYAIVGPSGDGKTTFLRCLLSLTEPSAGEEYLQCGEKKLRLSPSTRRFFAMVPQKSILFSGTVRDNLLLADAQATDEEMTEALADSCAWDFLRERDGLDTEILEGGEGLSSGQIQRIAIARALLRAAPVLVLDEATSALDTDTEAEVIEHIMKKKDNRITVITTHRPKILDYCDEVFRFDGEHLIKQS
ncbi:MAG: ABC transporter ATP-binding protein [Lachnospiraceae bacterium]|nr:ABC transporter ATP-binding protein [Lachnospiraceae bacterium]